MTLARGCVRRLEELLPRQDTADRGRGCDKNQNKTKRKKNRVEMLLLLPCCFAAAAAGALVKGPGSGSAVRLVFMLTGAQAASKGIR